MIAIVKHRPGRAAHGDPMHRWLIMAALLLLAGAPMGARADDAKDCGSAETLSPLDADLSKTASACHRIADQGLASAQTKLGGMYEAGKGVPLDYAEAAKWYGKAGDEGFAPAQYYLAQMYARALGVPQDNAEAVKWYRKAADRGFSPAQNSLGLMYKGSRGVSQDFVEAYKWFSLAASSQPTYNTTDRDEALRNRDIVALEMTPSEIQKAQALAAAWKSTPGQ